MAKGRIAKQAKTKLNMIIYGASFSGKTTLASQLAYYKREDGSPFRVLYIDAETGGLDSYLDLMEANGVNLGNIYILYTQSLTEVRQYIAKVKNNEDLYELDEDGNETDEIVKDAEGLPFRADAIVIDGATILNLTTQSGLVEFSKKRNKVKADKDGLIGDARLVKIEGAGLEIKDWNTIKFKGQDLILDLMSSGVHCITTCRETDEKESIRTEDGQIASVSTGRKIPDGFKGLEYNTNTVLRTFIDPETNQICAQVIKDRTGVHSVGEIIEDPSLLDWQVVLDRNKGKENFILKNDLTKAVEVEQELYAKEVLGRVGVPAEEIETSENNNVSTVTPDSLRAEINATIKAMTPVQKTEMKKKLTEAGLPTAFKAVTDIEVLKTVLSIVKQ
ncbi:AAA family ATPase [uncultured Mailhella sp.]|uniref:AAA family ATPase n=1 Tax=uncultured Mailhella sp. TaxID=1981031 RepID=UPI0025FFCA5E|nr:AAA family ATPase [uncultured Mailhella sp.]